MTVPSASTIAIGASATSRAAPLTMRGPSPPTRRGDQRQVELVDHALLQHRAEQAGAALGQDPGQAPVLQGVPGRDEVDGRLATDQDRLLAQRLARLREGLRSARPRG